MARKLSDTVQLKLRFSEALRRRLEREARRQEHSLNGEIINRLEQSFRKSEDADLLGSTLRTLFGGATGDLLRAIATAIWLIEKRTGKKWHEDPEIALQVNHAIDEIIDWFTWQRRDPAMDAARLKYRDLSSAPSLSDFWLQVGGGLEKVEYYSTRVAANTAALEALQKMGMAPSDAEIDEAATKYRADPKYLEAKERAAKYFAEYSDREKKGWPTGEKTVTKDDPTKDEGEGP